MICASKREKLFGVSKEPRLDVAVSAHLCASSRVVIPGLVRFQSTVHITSELLVTRVLGGFATELLGSKTWTGLVLCAQPELPSRVVAVVAQTILCHLKLKPVPSVGNFSASPFCHHRHCKGAGSRKPLWEKPTPEAE